MKNFLWALLQAVAIGIAALILINASVLILPASERAMTLAVVIAGTALLATLRWRIWPSQRRRDTTQQDEGAPLRAPAELEHRWRLQLRAVLGLLIALLLTWIVAGLAWMSYEDGESRSSILRGLARTSAVVVSVAILVMPPFQKDLRRSRYQLALAILLALGWLGGTILLPPICTVLGGLCYDIEGFVLAIPGWSFVPIVALLLRSIGARLGIAYWRSPD